MTRRLDAFGSDWSAAELDRDTEGLATVLADDFYALGALGSVLPKPAWLDRHHPDANREAR